MSFIITSMSQLNLSDVTTMGNLKDTFLTLPVEIRIEILSYLGTRRNITPITAASPCMLDTYIENEMYIRRTFYKRTFTDRMMQDALAFITFPPNTYGSLNIGHPVILSHKARWMSRELPCPFNTTRRNDIDDLDSLYHRLDNRIPKYWVGLPNNPNGPVNWVARSQIEIQRHLQKLLKSEILKEWWYNILARVVNGGAILRDMEKTVYDTSN
ncbi:uncharacterized protein FIESC28_03221 [Fusarium coffeatum]|uniref:F-box domain-containing protein n=1 Tax=Fusarium coffeatum TaxID=231269 RepID=A0A366S3N4_9HYPO|nr:uncharacterized protein FIESC28_03221 [Fusarium coffeatum]RBR23911.1 hypothetical protein FIESC28_03221 [Fusarium coffeatum]